MNIARLTMGKISPSDQMRIQTLHEQKDRFKIFEKVVIN